MKKITKILRTATLVILSVIIATPTYADIPDEDTIDRLSNSNAYYYNPGSNSESCVTSSTTISGDGVAEKIWNFFIQQGFNDAQAAGLLGNAQAESGLRVAASSSGSYYGLFQWGAGRKDNLFKKISGAGLSKYTSSEYWKSDSSIPADDFDKLLQVELEFTMEETTMNWQSELKQSDSPELSAEIFLTLFERAVAPGGSDTIKYYSPYLGKPYQATSRRREFAKNFYNDFAGKSAKDTISYDNCGINTEFQSLVKAYAWPTYHSAPWHERMPAYANAVTQSISEGRYVGGSVAGVPGIDCGGFVTILVQNSGLEPNYNDTKGPTSAQENWVKTHGWKLLNASPSTEIDTSILQPGDIAFTNAHTFIYVGEIPDFHSVIASASYSDHGAGRAPMAGMEDLVYGYNIVRWYRKN